MIIRRIRRCVREGRYEFSVHALEEMDEDDLTEPDARNVLLRGVIVAELTDDPRGARYLVRGTTKGLPEEVAVVCRFLPSGRLRVITVYTLEESRI
ncbi:MAG: DUF4258 domain-containing protein [Myxococcaceae bacterium]